MWWMGAVLVVLIVALLLLLKTPSKKEATHGSFQPWREQKPGIRENITTQNFLSRDECDRLIELIDRMVNNSREQESEQQIFNMKSFKDPLVDSIRQRVHDFMKSKINRELYIDSSYMKVRRPGKHEYAHPIHADNCNYCKDTGKCIIETQIDYWVSHSVLIYLNKCKGGDFFFADGETITPEPGLFLAFSSGPENLHGVHRIESDRYAIAMWFTEDPEREEKY